MKICVINGSPKGVNSVTLQTVLYIQRLFPDNEYSFLHVGQRLRAYERDMSGALAELESAELLLFCYPVYTFIAPYQLHRFIELLKASGVDLAGKLAGQLTTSKHFFDVTAHRYIEENCRDLGLNYLGGLSADMEDLLSEQGRREAREFWKYLEFRVKNPPALSERTPPARPEPYASALSRTEKSAKYDCVIITNVEPDDDSLHALTVDFQNAFPYKTRVVNIAEYPFAGGCLGCFNCAADGKCVYKDGFDDFLRESIQTADATVYAFTIRDHSMGASFKRYDDRQFCNGHRTVTMGKPVGYLIRGDYSAEANLRMVIEGRAQVGHNFLAGTAADARGVAELSRTLAYALESGLELPRDFYGVGGMKIFRDLIWQMRGLMRADHLFYKAHGVYDFPQKQPGKMLKMQLLGSLLRSPALKSKIGGKMTEGMLAPYKKALAAAETKEK